jgi:hypothetical protein
VVLGMRAELLVPAFKSIHGMVALMVILPRRLVYAEMERVSMYVRLAIGAKVGDATGPVTLADGRQNSRQTGGAERINRGVLMRDIPNQISGKGICKPVKRGTRIAH